MAAIIGAGRLTASRRPGNLTALFAFPWWHMGQREPANDGRQHPCEADLAAFAVGRLSGLRVALIEQHVIQCDRCAAVVAQSPGDEFVDRLRRAERAQPAAEQTLSWHKPRSIDDAGRIDGNLNSLPIELQQHPRYEFLRLLAQGGMGAVYLARHRVTGSLLAIKAIKPELAANRDAMSRFLREASIAGQLEHPNVARVWDAEQLEDTAILAMDYVPGKTLAQIVSARGPLPVDEACHYIRQIALGLQYASEQGVVHRDIKPQNVMVSSPDGSVRILDFGLGRLVDERRTHFRLTKDDQVLGTPDYMAPEQARDAKTADVRSDIYSLGCTFYSLLIGEPPFGGSSAIEVLTRHDHERPAPVHSLRRDVPRELSDLVERMLAKNPDGRPQQPKEIVQLLSTCTSRGSAGDPATRRSGLGHVPSAMDRILDAIVGIILSPAFLLPLLTALVCLLLLVLK